MERRDGVYKTRHYVGVSFYDYESIELLWKYGSIEVWNYGVTLNVAKKLPVFIYRTFKGLVVGAFAHHIITGQILEIKE